MLTILVIGIIIWLVVRSGSSKQNRRRTGQTARTRSATPSRSEWPQSSESSRKATATVESPTAVRRRTAPPKTRSKRPECPRCRRYIPDGEQMYRDGDELVCYLCGARVKGRELTRRLREAAARDRLERRRRERRQRQALLAAREREQRRLWKEQPEILIEILGRRHTYYGVQPVFDGVYWFQVNVIARVAVLDVHKYTVENALDLIDVKVRECTYNAYRALIVAHGSGSAEPSRIRSRLHQKLKAKEVLSGEFVDYRTTLDQLTKNPTRTTIWLQPRLASGRPTWTKLPARDFEDSAMSAR